MKNRDEVSKAYLALAVICVVWGTTYTAIKFCVRDFPPYLMVGLRQSTAGLILLALAFSRGHMTGLKSGYIWRQAFTGVVMITGGNGFITWGMQYVSSGLSSVIGALTPVMVVLFAFLAGNNERVNVPTVLGVLLGFGGLGLIFSHGWQDFLNPQYRWGIIACLGSCCSWSLGTVLAKRWNAPGVSPFLNAGLQIFAGGLGGFLMSALLDTTHQIHHTMQGWLALAYLALIGSALAFSLYMYALQYLSVAVSSLYTYINPVVALLLGWLWLGESVTLWAIAGMFVTLGGVWLVNKGQQ